MRDKIDFLVAENVSLVRENEELIEIVDILNGMLRNAVEISNCNFQQMVILARIIEDLGEDN